MKSPTAITTGVVIALLMAACGSSSEQAAGDATSPGPPVESQDPATESATDDEGTTAEDGVLEPLANGFPEQPITLLNRTEVGDSSDIFLRAIAPIAEKYSPVPVTVRVEPLGAARGQWAFEDWAPGQDGGTEGYFLHHLSWPAVPLRYLQVELGPGSHYSKLQPVIMMSAANFVVGVPAGSPYTTIEELIEAASQEAGSVSMAVLSQSQLEFAARLLAKEAGAEFHLVPASSPTESVQIMLGGGADAVLVTPAPLLAQVEAGEASALLQIGDERASVMSDVPTSVEAGYDIPLGTRDGLATYSETPPEHVEWLNRLFTLVAEDEEFQGWLDETGKDRLIRNHEEIPVLLDQIHDEIRPIVEELGLLVEGND